jgi:parallel beta-helix repeat protein
MQDDQKMCERRNFRFLLSVSIFFVMVVSSISAAGGIIYVKENGTGGGTSWGDAYGDLQDALADANSVDKPVEIWVAEGTYYPTSDYGLEIGDRGKHFRMINGVAIYGGFPADGDTFANRDPNHYETILSGDIGITDDPNDNCYHLFYHPDGTNLDTTAILDGFTITAGKADAPYPSPHRSGSGMYNKYSSPTVTGCTFSNNSAYDSGGGMYNDCSSRPTVISCTFSGNSAADGGGMLNESSNPTVTNCTFSSNSAIWGGGMFNFESNPMVISCTFSGNSVIAFGGGMYNYWSNTPTVEGCIFSGNSAIVGGGMFNDWSSTPTITGCIFGGNSADYSGGGISNENYSSPTVINCTFNGNHVDYDGGGGMSNENYSSPTVTGCTFTDNSADYGGGMSNEESFCNPIVSNCIFWGNSASSNGDEIALIDSSTIDVSFCDIQGGQSGIYDDGSGTINWGSSNIDVDPLFVDADGADNTIGTEDDNLRLQASSDCIDLGDNSVVTVATDLDGQGRIVDGDGNGDAVVDMGAYEYYGDVYEPTVIYVDAGGAGDFTTIQAGIDAANPGFMVIVADGTYTGDDNRDIDFGGKAITVRSENGPENCVIDCQGDPNEPHRGFIFQNGEYVNSVLDGFTITNGYAPMEEIMQEVDNGIVVVIQSYWGGGIFCNSSNPTIANCVVRDNFAIVGGGGIFCYSAMPVLVNCGFTDNTAQHGGGMYNWYSRPTVRNCTFSSNSSDYGGGGMYNYEYSHPTVDNCTFTSNYGRGMENENFSNPIVTSCTFSGNFGSGMSNFWESSPAVTGCTFIGNSAYRGGGMCNSDSNPTVTNCTFSGNSADLYGGGMYNDDNNLTVTGCTFSGNSADNAGGGMYNDDSNLTVTNCTFAGNSAENGNGLAFDSYNQSWPSDIEMVNCILWDGGGEIWNNDGSTITISYSDVQDGWLGVGNIDVDPLFVDPGYWDDNGTATDPNDDFWVDGDYHLGFNSPCINAGDPAGDYNGMVDMDGEVRVRNGRVDIGADEGFIVFGDFEPDWDVDLADVAVFVSHWCETGCAESNWCGNSDFNRSGSTDLYDFAILSGNWQLPIVHSNLVGYWKMNDNAFNAVVLDSSGNGNDGLAQQNTVDLSYTGAIADALNFDGINDYVDCGSDPSFVLTEDFSIGLWFYARNWDTPYPSFISARESYSSLDWQLFYNSGFNRIEFYYGNSGAYQLFYGLNVNPSLETWHHLFVTREGDTWSLYLDGVPQGTNIQSGAMPTGDNIRIGILGQGLESIGLFDGLIDEVKIYGKALSSADVGNLYGEGEI